MENHEFHTVRGYQLLEQNKKILTSALEDYLEMIYRNIDREGFLRINELAELLHVQNSSATKMAQKLGALGLIRYRKYGMIFLTDDGRELGKFLLDRHNIIAAFLKALGATGDLLVETELIEHNISTDTLGHMKRLALFFERYPDVAESFRRFAGPK